ncbi:MAG: hypothetical protein Q7S58_15310 [Candidatus Binatus sp.]|uniref:hypothetical protein n=1 Tax=Candidatus Binatus sp. TaxID=2811406 RepID=UPI0027202CCD|nr:hypothetical protein [Candidatus Binatus sp.]MDO8433769.1 hypothetical protein [Candidatus Binatus sp.]
MKNRRLIAFVACALLAIAAPAMADLYSAGPAGKRFERWLTRHPNVASQLSANPYLVYNPGWRAEHTDVQEFFEQHPDVWQGMAAESRKYYSDRFRQFLSNHREIARDISENPSLLYNPVYLDAHPRLQEFLAQNRSVWQWGSLGTEYARVPDNYGDAWGDYDENRQWHDYYWWHQNRPDWFWSHHPEWAANEPAWRDYDGDFDETRQWHDRNWWAQNRADWVKTHHRDWGDWDENRQWHDRDWWAQNRVDWVARNRTNWLQQRQTYEQALRNAQAKAQQQDLKIKQLRDQQRASQLQEQSQRQQAARLEQQRQQQQESARLEQQQKMHRMPPIEVAPPMHKMPPAGVGVSNAPPMHKMPPIAVQPPMHKMPPAGVGSGSGEESRMHRMPPVEAEPKMHKIPPIAAEPRTPQAGSDVAQQNMKKMNKHGKAEPAPQGAVHESKEINGGAGEVNH